MECAKRSAFFSREAVTSEPSASIRSIDRTVAPNGPCGTGQPWALTANVLATPKSLFDCMTVGEKPIASSLAMTSFQRAPARTRYSFFAVSTSMPAEATVIAVPFLGRLCPPMECRAALKATGRFSAAADFSSARRFSTKLA